MASTPPETASQPARSPLPTTGVHNESGRDAGEGSGPSESTACRACQATKSKCDMEKPYCERCQDLRLQCEYTESTRPVSDDIFIYVMGATGSGKTSFINQCVGSQVLQVGHGLQSRKQSIVEAVFELDGKKIHLIDTPVFNDTAQFGVRVLMLAEEWLAVAYGVSTEANGVVYMYRMSDRGVTNATLNFGDNSARFLRKVELSNLAFVTITWNEVDREAGRARELELSSQHLKAYLKGIGRSVYQHDGTRASALRVVSSLSSGKQVELLQIQQPQIKQHELQVAHEEIDLSTWKMTHFGDSTLYPLRGPLPPSKRSSSIKHKQRKKGKLEVHTSDSEGAADGFKSNLARKQNRPRASETGTSEREISMRNAEIRPRQLRLRALHEERVALRAEIYRTSLHALGSRLLQYASAGILSEQINKELKTLGEDIGTSISGQSSGTVQNLDFDAQTPNFRIEKDYQDVLFDEKLREGPGTNADLISYWLYSRFWLCRNLGIVVYRNCCRLQTAHLANGFLSALVPADSWSGREPCVVKLIRIQIGDIEALLNTLANCIRNIFNRGLHILSGQEDIQLLVECFYDVQARSGKLSASIDPMGSSKSVSANDLEEEIQRLYAGERLQSNHLISIFARCRYTFQALDLILLAYEGAHVSDFEESPHGSLNKHTILLGEGFPAFAEPSRSPTTCFRRLPMKCLAPLLGNRDVWVFTHTMLDCPSALYLSTDIETFADVWGPVWKVKDQHEPDKAARYNVGEGSIIPWPFDPMVHPTLATNDRLCHWRSNFDFINNDASSIDDDSSSTSSEAGEAPTDDATSGRFDGSEVLVIGAESGPQLEWEPCCCSVDELKQQLKEAGRLNHMFSSKSYRYVDSQQTSLVVGSHGIQAGRSKVFKDMKEEPLKKGLLAMWENEPELRDPREFENFWGVAVSLCNMNARRVRLVELLREDSVKCLLEGFQWSDLDADKNSERRSSFFRAVSSVNPCALGDLWDSNPSWREELGKALLICLRVLSRTGYDVNRDEFHMLWLPSGCRAPRRVTLRPTDQSWIRFLRDTTYSMTTAVIVERSLGGPSCSRKRPQWFGVPSVLETALCINRTLDPAPKLKKTPGCPDEVDLTSRTDAQRWKHVWNVSGLARGEHLWVGSENRLKVLWPLSDWHLLLEVDIVKRALLREMIGIRPSERVSHWEYTDEEAEPIDIRPIPVHII